MTLEFGGILNINKTFTFSDGLGSIEMSGGNKDSNKKPQSPPLEKPQTVPPIPKQECEKKHITNSGKKTR